MFQLDEYPNQRSLFAAKRIDSFGYSEISQRPIDPNDVRCYAHVLPKGSYPHLKLVERNIMMIHPEEHTIIDQGTARDREKYSKMHPMTKWYLWDEREAEMLEIHRLHGK